MRISDWSSDVCSSDLQFGPGCGLRTHPHHAVDADLAGDLAVVAGGQHQHAGAVADRVGAHADRPARTGDRVAGGHRVLDPAAGRVDVEDAGVDVHAVGHRRDALDQRGEVAADLAFVRSAAHTPELQSLIRVPYAVFC